ncbi:MAG: hypothetical protein ABIJ34_04565, partial [archaeon]
CALPISCSCRITMYEKRKNYELIYLLVISLALALVFLVSYSYFSTQHLTSFHDLDYYASLVNIYYSKNISTFFSYYDFLSNPIVYPRSLIFMYIYGPTYSAFIFSSAILNAVLTFMLFFLLKKIFDDKFSFNLIMIIIGSSFFIELISFPYIDLTFFLLLAIFQCLLYLACEKKENSPWIIPVLILIILTKQDFLSLIFLTSAFAIGYAYFRKYFFPKRLIILIFFGILLGLFIFSLFVKFNPLTYNFERVEKARTLTNGSDTLRSMFLLFPNVYVSILIYGMALSLFIKKESVIWILLFIANRLHQIVITIIGIKVVPRFNLMTYFVSMVIFLLFVKKINQVYRLIYIPILALFIFNLANINTNSMQYVYTDGATNYWFADFFSKFQKESNYYFESDPSGKGFDKCYNMDRDLNIPRQAYSDGYLEDYRILANFEVVETISEADYILCEKCSSEITDGFRKIDRYRINTHVRSICNGKEFNLYVRTA